MPTLRIREVRLPELHLPEMSRDDIGRAIGDATRDIDLSRLDPRGKDMPEIDLSKIELPKIDLKKIDLSGIDIPKAVATASAMRGKSRRSRLPFVVGGLITLGLVGFALMSSPAVRPRLTSLGQRLKEKVDERRAAMDARRDADEAHAFDAAVAVPIERSAFASSAPKNGSPFDGSSELPEGLGADVASESPTAYAALADETTPYAPANEVRTDA
jgi:hypothetical protein